MKDFEVVISGISGNFPECSNVVELEQHIYNDENLVKLLKTGSYVGYFGDIKNKNKFDHTFFGLPLKLAEATDYNTRHALMKSFEAVVDSGTNYKDLSGSNTAVIASSYISDTEGLDMIYISPSSSLMVGQSRCMQSNRVSYCLNLKGPSYSMNCPWDSSLQSLVMAQHLIMKGHSRAAIVVTSNINLIHKMDTQYRLLERLNSDGKTKSYSADANGYSRADSVVAFYLQRAEDARRVYCSVVKAMSEMMISTNEPFNSPADISRLLGEFYADIPINKSEIAYIEGDGSAVPAFDAVELNAFSEVLCADRSKPLLVTSSKSKVGHSEASAAFVGIVSVIIAMKNGYIPPVLHYTAPNPHVPALKDGRIQIVTEKTPLEGDYVAVSSLGMNCSYGHILLKRNPKTRADRTNDMVKCKIPKVFLLCGRNEEAMKSILNEINEKDIDDEFYALNQLLFRVPFQKQLFYGYAIKGETENVISTMPSTGEENRPVWFIFSGMGSQWPEMCNGIMQVPIIRESIERSHRVLEKKGIDLISIMTDSDPKIYDNILHSFIGIAAIQIALVDMLEELGVTPDGIVGHSVGELGCAYADKCLTAEQMLLAAYARGRASLEATLLRGMMAAVGKGYKEIVNALPEGIEVACHNSATSCTLSGPTDLMENYIESLKSKGIFAKLVNVSNIAYHSKYIAPAGPLLRKYLQEIIPEPTLRSSKWISSSIPESRWETDLAMYNSAEYHTNNLLNYVLFEEATAHVPKNAICIEIAPHGLLQAIIKKSLPDCTHIPLTKRGTKDCFFTVEALAKLSCHGGKVDLTKLYPKVELPVSRETNFLHQFCIWDDEKDLLIIHFNSKSFDEMRGCVPTITNGDIFTHPNEYLDISSDHMINGYAICPTAKLLTCILKLLEFQIDKKASGGSFKFENVKIHGNISLHSIYNNQIELCYQKGTSYFEAQLPHKAIISGKLLDSISSVDCKFRPDVPLTKPTHISGEAIYEYFTKENCIFKNSFRNIIDMKVCHEGFVGHVKWNADATMYLDALLKMLILYYSIMNDELVEIESIGEIYYTPAAFPKCEDDTAEVHYRTRVEELFTEGIKMYKVRVKPASLNLPKINPEVKKIAFVPYTANKSEISFLEECLQTVIELTGNNTFNIVKSKESQIYKLLSQCEYFKQVVNSEDYNVRVIDVEEVRQSPMKTKAGHSSVLVVSDGALDDSLLKLLETSIQNIYLIQLFKNNSKSNSLKTITPIFLQQYDDYSIAFFKKTINPLSDANYQEIQGNFDSSYNWNDGIIETRSNFLLLRYDNFSEIYDLLEIVRNGDVPQNTRLVLLERKGPNPDLTSDFFLKQFMKDLKINVCYQGEWGSVKHFHIPIKPKNKFKVSQQALMNLKCDDIDVKMIGLNTQSFVTSSKNLEVGLLEYVGVKKGSEDIVMGLGELTANNVVIPDPILTWKKPAWWSLTEAVTVPLFYSMAYYLLCIKCISTLNPTAQKLLIHGGHSAFAQAFIYLALRMKVTVFATCFTKEQKKYILMRFPQISQNNIFVMNENNRMSVIDDINVTSRGVDLIIDSLNDHSFRRETMKCGAFRGRYVLISHNKMPSDFNFGMNIFLREFTVLSLNTDLILNLPDNEKCQIVKLMKEGMERGHVIPLKATVLDGNSTINLVHDAIMEEYNNKTEVRKLLIDLELPAVKDKEQNQNKSADVSTILQNGEQNHATNHLVENSEVTNGTKEPAAATENENSVNGISSTESSNHKKNNYIIIGHYNGLWFDLMKWLVSWGAENVYIIIDRFRIPSHIQIRYNNFLNTCAKTNVYLLDIEILSSQKKLEHSFEQITDLNVIDKAFFLVPGLESKMKAVDLAMRKLFPECWLVNIGPESNSYDNSRRIKDGFKSTNFNLDTRSMDNSRVMNALDDWFRKSDKENNQCNFITSENKDDINAGILYPAILPKTLDDIAELWRDSSEKPMLVEHWSHGLNSKFARDLHPVIIFPGFKIVKIKKFTSKLSYPSYVAKYSQSMTSLDAVAAEFTKEILRRFGDLSMYTLVAEGWAGQLVLKVTYLLESHGKLSEVILLDASPRMVRNWTRYLSKSIITNVLPSSCGNDEAAVLKYLKGCKDISNDLMALKRNDDVTREEVSRGMDALINRLEIIGSTNHNKDCNFLNGKVHFFTVSRDYIDNLHNLAEIDEISNIHSSNHIIENCTSEDYLESENLISDINHLILYESRVGCRKQKLSQIAVLDTK